MMASDLRQSFESDISAIDSCATDVEANEVVTKVLDRWTGDLTIMPKPSLIERSSYIHQGINTLADRTNGDPVNPAELATLRDFEIDRVLSCDLAHKSTALAGHFRGDPSAATAVVALQRKPFDAAGLPGLLAHSALTLDFANAEYAIYNMACRDASDMPAAAYQVSGKDAGIGGDIKCDVIYPATAKHLAKYEMTELRVLRETPEVYRSVTQPWVQRGELGERIRWVHNILEGTEEAERVLLRDSDPRDGFVLLPDMKWDQSSPETNLYCLAIVNRLDLASLRDLTAEHIPMLRNVLDKSCEAIAAKYGVARDRLRVFLHYPPTFYHVHVHFAHVHRDQASSDVHMVDTVLSNLGLVSDYYSRVPLQIKLWVGHPLYRAMGEAGALLS